MISHNIVRFLICSTTSFSWFLMLSYLKDDEGAEISLDYFRSKTLFIIKNIHIDFFLIFGWNYVLYCTHQLIYVKYIECLLYVLNIENVLNKEEKVYSSWGLHTNPTYQEKSKNMCYIEKWMWWMVKGEFPAFLSKNYWKTTKERNQWKHKLSMSKLHGITNSVKALTEADFFFFPVRDWTRNKVKQSVHNFRS